MVLMLLGFISSLAFHDVRTSQSSLPGSALPGPLQILRSSLRPGRHRVIYLRGIRSGLAAAPVGRLPEPSA
jgi:hypothetical protein